jgi:hypothetical protein
MRSLRSAPLIARGPNPVGLAPRLPDSARAMPGNDGLQVRTAAIASLRSNRIGIIMSMPAVLRTL